MISITKICSIAILSLTTLFPSFQVMSMTNEETGLRVKYLYSQKITADKERIDTLTLDIMGAESLFFDQSVERKLEEEKSFTHRIDTMKVSNNKDGEYERLLLLNNPSNERVILNDCISAVIYKDRSKASIITTDGDSRMKLALSENIAPQEWSILDDTCQIQGYLCNKATTLFRGRVYEAWFSFDLPVDDGPWKLYGLPGLILKVVDSEQTISFECIDLAGLKGASVSAPDISSFEKCKNRDQMYKFQQNKAKNLIGGFFNNGIFTAYRGGAAYTPIKLEIDD